MGKEGEEKRPSFRMSRSFNLRKMFEVPRSPRTDDHRHVSKNYSNVPLSDADLLKERFAKLLLGEDMSGGGKGASSALALSNAITNLAASVFGEQKKLEPMSADRKRRWRKEIDLLLSVTDHIVEFVPALRKLDAMLINGRSSLGDSLYKNITDEYFDPEKFLMVVDLKTEHKVLDLKNRIEASVVIWRRKVNNKDYKSHWTGMPPTVSVEKREMFEERAETILAILKQRFPGLPQFMFSPTQCRILGMPFLKAIPGQ